MLKSRCGIVAALAFLCCGSQSEAADGSSSKLMADLPKSQGPEWVLYEDIPEDGEIVSFDNAGDTEGAFEICQSEAGIVGTLEESPYGAVCDTKDGAEESFYVLRVRDQDDQEDEEQESAGFVITMPVEAEESIGTGMFPDFDWTEEEKEEIARALGATDAWQRFVDEELAAQAENPGLFIRGKGYKVYNSEGQIEYWEYARMRAFYKGDGAGAQGGEVK